MFVLYISKKIIYGFNAQRIGFNILSRESLVERETYFVLFYVSFIMWIVRVHQVNISDFF